MNRHLERSWTWKCGRCGKHVVSTKECKPKIRLVVSTNDVGNKGLPVRLQ